ncbi:unnamed protein product [Ranitomeya imitator]|uniref:Uncharacterized protein n=1 Tax=Ranitomeya imitator TaxID=111125 RepID=A0ABN9LKB3_9NEOB|nr:unnamed protein product [Ranitomeya imitator]
MVTGLQTMSYEEQLQDFGMFSLQKRRHRGDLIAVYKYLKGCHIVEGSSLFSFAQGKTRSNGIKLNVRVINEWSRLPREVCVLSSAVQAAGSGAKDAMREGPAMTLRSCDRDVITGPAFIPTLGPEAARAPHTAARTKRDLRKLPNMFGSLRSTMMSLMIGSYASSAITFPVLKLIYEAGVSFVGIMLGWSSLACLIFLNCLINWPKESIPSPEESAFTKKVTLRTLALDHKVTGDQFYTHVTTVGQRLSRKGDPEEQHLSNEDLSKPAKNSGSSTTFLQNARSPIFLFSVITMMMTQLRIIFFMASMNRMIEYLVLGTQDNG